MNLDRWRDVVEQIKENFEVVEEDHLSDGSNGSEVDYIIFNGPVGKMKLEFITRPILLDTKTKYSNRIGSSVEVEHIYSETESSHALAAWRWDEATDDWVSFAADSFIN